MACYFNAARIKWANRCSSPLRGINVPPASSSLPLFSSYYARQAQQLRLPLDARYKSTITDATFMGKWYAFMTKPRAGFGSFTVLCGHAAPMCTLLAYSNTDMLDLRCLALSGGALSLSFQYFRPNPMWIPIRWNCLIFCINGIMITQILLERHRANNMSPELQKIYNDGEFDERGFSKVQFLKLFNNGRRMVFSTNEIICREGKEMNKLYYILDGTVTVKSKTDGRKLATISQHHFIGELSFLMYVRDRRKDEQKTEPSNKASANVFADDTVHVLEWDFIELSKIMVRDRELANAFAVYSSHDLRNKLLSANAKGDKPMILPGGTPMILPVETPVIP